MVPVVSVYDNLGGHSASFEKYWLKLYFLCLLMKCVIWEKTEEILRLRYIVFIAFLLSTVSLALSEKAIRVAFGNFLF